MTPWVLRLLIANIAVFLFLGRDTPLFSDLVLIPAFVPARPWTLVTYMFLHANFGHIFANMLSLFFFGPRLEAHLGSGRFLGLYFVSGIAGALLSFVFSPYAPIIGASGAVFGVMVGFARYWPREPIYFWGVLPVQARLLVIALAAIDLASGLGLGLGRGNIAYFAHVGGFIGGYLYLLIAERGRLHRPRARSFPSRPSAPPVSRGNMQKWSRINRDALHPVNRAEYDRIMQKIQEEGPARLTERERAFLDMFADR